MGDELKQTPGWISGTIFGVFFLISGLALWIFAPDFSGFFERGHSEDVLSVWKLLIGLAIINFGYAAVSRYIQNRSAKSNESPMPSDHKQEPGSDR
jgi:hypothetical protein